MKGILPFLLLLTLPALAQDFSPGPYTVSFAGSAVVNPTWPGFSSPNKKSAKVARFADRYVLTIKKVVNRDWLLVSYRPGKQCYIPADPGRLLPAPSEPCLPDSRGEFSRRTLHYYFEVVDPDPDGLNAHVPPGSHREIGDDLPNAEVESWPVVTKLPKGTVLCGYSIVWIGQLVDSKKRTWMFFSGPNGQKYWVRANRRFIHPIPGPDPSIVSR